MHQLTLYTKSCIDDGKGANKTFFYEVSRLLSPTNLVINLIFHVYWPNPIALKNLYWQDPVVEDYFKVKYSQTHSLYFLEYPMCFGQAALG